jgi:hypothetical protein
MKIPLNPPFAKGEVTPPFPKACLPVGRGGGEEFKKAIFNLTIIHLRVLKAFLSPKGRAWGVRELRFGRSNCGHYLTFGAWNLVIIVLYRVATILSIVSLPN